MYGVNLRNVHHQSLSLLIVRTCRIVFDIGAIKHSMCKNYLLNAYGLDMSYGLLLLRPHALVTVV